MQRDELTREEAIRRHRKLWNYIADQTERTGKVIDKTDALVLLWPGTVAVLANCWLCEYAGKKCMEHACPICWPGGYCVSRPNEKYTNSGLYDLLIQEQKSKDPNVKFYAALARVIANLPEREVGGP